MKDSEEAPKAQSEPAPVRRWGAELKPVVNTSLPAQLAPKLAPVTLAAATAIPASGITRELQPIRLGPNPKKAPVSSMEDFPTLGGAKTFKTTPINPSMSFAALSRDWAKKQQDDERKALEEAEKEAIHQIARQKEREQTELDERSLRKIGIIAIPQLSSKKVDEEEERLKMEEKRRLSDDEYESDPIEEEEEDEDEEENLCDGVWDSRKHRDELY
jgi:hypothetical protein